MGNSPNWFHPGTVCLNMQYLTSKNLAHMIWQWSSNLLTILPKNDAPRQQVSNIKLRNDILRARILAHEIAIIFLSSDASLPKLYFLDKKQNKTKENWNKYCINHFLIEVIFLLINNLTHLWICFSVFLEPKLIVTHLVVFVYPIPRPVQFQYITVQ